MTSTVDWHCLLGHDYYPQWLDNLADDVTLEAAAMDGTAHGAEDVRSIVVIAKELYENQQFSYAGPCGDNGFLELYTVAPADSRMPLSDAFTPDYYAAWDDPDLAARKRGLAAMYQPKEESEGYVLLRRQAAGPTSGSVPLCPEV